LLHYLHKQTFLIPFCIKIAGQQYVKAVLPKKRFS